MQKLSISILIIVLSHLVLIGLYPLMDTTEARYADVARRMLALNDWITPWFDDHQPFWGKPPLSFWLTMLGFKLFGLNEFGARFFYWVVSLAVMAITYLTARTLHKQIALTTIAVLTSFTLFYIASVSVMTDMVLVLGGSICLLSQIQAISEKSSKSINSLLLALGLSIGLLAKGPLALIVFLTPMLGWALSAKSFNVLLRCYQPFLVLLVTLMLTLPWYILAEQKTPGFLNYFILGEHWQRFVTPGWKGDLYGTAHKFPRGTIWLFLLVATFPWCVILPVLAWLNKTRGIAWKPSPTSTPTHMAIGMLLMGWVLTPLVFFSFAGNILWTYVLPCLPALAILISLGLHQHVNPKHLHVTLHGALVTVVALKVGFLAHQWLDNGFEKKSAKSLVAQIQASNIDLTHVYFYRKLPFSAKFYGRGQIKVIQDLSEIANAGRQPKLFIVKKNNIPNHPILKAQPLPKQSYGPYVMFIL